MERSKEEALEQLTGVLEASGTGYAIIGGIALQLYRSEPRTTLDIDVAVLERAGIPREALERAGFSVTGVFEHSENWSAPDGTPVQFTDDPNLREAVEGSDVYEAGALRFRVLRVDDLLRAKLRAAADPARRRSKRLLDLADAQGLIEDRPELAKLLTPDERALLERL
jgi:hypothetical protein